MIKHDMDALINNDLDLVSTNRLILELALRHENLIIINQEYNKTIRLTVNTEDADFLDIAKELINGQ